MEKQQSLQITITGRVQNVGFRYHTQDKAIELNIKGFVMNQPNGNVYIEAEGPGENLNQFVSWCHQGPNWAKVTNVSVTEQPNQGFEQFKIKRH